MIDIKNSINEFKKYKWEKLVNHNLFLEYDFLKAFSDHQKNVDHYFIFSDTVRLYGHAFSLNFQKILRHSRLSFFSFIFKIINIRVIYLTNTFITNVASFYTTTKVDLDNILSKINYDYKIAIIPDFLFNKSITFKKIIKVEVDSEMILPVKKEWKSIIDYKLALKTKYRKKIINIEDKSRVIKIRLLNINDFDKYYVTIEKLFNNVFLDSKFSGPKFNITTFKSLLLLGKLNIQGYFLDNKLVAFSSYIDHGEILYSYFVGFDKKKNKTYLLYSRILLEQINKAIQLNKKKLILGRTANEFKSNFGAVPKKSHIYVYVKNGFLRFFLTQIISNLQVNNWLLRQPFKKE